MSTFVQKHRNLHKEIEELISEKLATKVKTKNKNFDCFTIKLPDDLMFNIGNTYIVEVIKESFIGNNGYLYHFGGVTTDEFCQIGDYIAKKYK
jgi:hypothetical protein